LSNSVGDRIREARQARGMTQAQLGRGVATKGFISQIERDRARPSLPKLQVIAARLGLAIDELVGQRPTAELAYLVKSAELAVRAGEPARALELADEATASVVTTSQRATLHRIRGMALDAMGRWDEALRSHQAAAATAPPDDPELNAAIYVEIGTVLQLQERFNAAIEANLRAIDWLDRCQHAEPSLRPRALTNLAMESYSLGQMEPAMEYSQRALSAASDAESLFRIANAHMVLGVAAHDAGDLDAALEHSSRALEMHRRIGQEQIANRILNNLGDVHFAAGRREEARACQRQCLTRARQLHDAYEVAVAAAELARYALVDCDYEQASALAREAKRAAVVARDHVREAVGLAYEARALAGLGDARGADRLFKRAFRLLADRDAVAKLAHVCALYGEVLRERGQVDRAFAILQMASERDFKRLASLTRGSRPPR
jgi:HTH-type transcriptional regulator, quorum sensing regulator NprR